MVDQRNALGLMRNGRAVRASVDFDQPADLPAAAVAGSAPVLVDPDLIRKDGGTQMRVRLDAETVHEYHAMIKEAGGGGKTASGGRAGGAVRRRPHDGGGVILMQWELRIGAAQPALFGVGV